MQATDIRASVIATLRRIAPEADAATIDDSAPLRDALDLDSMDFLNFVIGLHKALEVDIPEADYPKLATLRGAIDYLSKKLQRA